VPALIAALDASGAVLCATSGFMERFDVRDGVLAPCPEEVELVAGGHANRRTVQIDDLQTSLAAVADRHGRRLALLMVSSDREDDDIGPASPLLDEPLDESPAIVWLKDLDGRYLRVNSRYLDQLAIDADSVRGQTDAELTAARSIEGMRLEDKDIASSEPLELEYLIGAFEERPAFAALRFALRDGDGQPTATCSVAAPLPEAALARSECDRLMRIDRWRRLDAVAIRQELLEEWGLALTDGSVGPPLDRDERVAAALSERDEALAATARLEEELAQEREQLDGVRAESEQAARRAEELDGAVTAEQTRSEELRQSLAREEEHVTELQTELSVAQAELAEREVPADELQDDSPADGTEGLKWGAGAQHALSTALVGVTEWRAALKLATDILGSEGGWDATIAWCAERPGPAMRCGVVWMRDPAELASIESRAWKHVEDPSTAEFGRARKRMAATCLLDLQSAEDPLLAAAAAEGIGSAILVPISDGGDTVAMLELLSRGSATPSPELVLSLDAVAQQLGALARLLKFTDDREWRLGRL
jgi:PAS domain-containing protein/flagellar motor protein MotB